MKVTAMCLYNKTIRVTIDNRSGFKVTQGIIEHCMWMNKDKR